MTIKTYGPPNEGDQHMLASIVGNLHVSTPDDVVATDIRNRLAKIKLTPEHGALTIQAWIAAALKIHHANRDLFFAVAKGNLIHVYDPDTDE